MTKSIHILSICESKNKKYSIFGLKGQYKGIKVKNVYIENLNFEINKEYVAKVYNIRIVESNLFAKCHQFKEIIRLC